jgi:hypothetical protein
VTSHILKDATVRPELFHFHGAVDRRIVEAYFADMGWKVPDDLTNFLIATGGGDLFETETILGLNHEEGLDDDLLTVNEYYRDAGLPEQMVVFHTGLGISAVRLMDGSYVWLQPESFKILATFASLNDWYRSVLRSEYATRYRLDTG